MKTLIPQAIKDILFDRLVLRSVDELEEILHLLPVHFLRNVSLFHRIFPFLYWAEVYCNFCTRMNTENTDFFKEKSVESVISVFNSSIRDCKIILSTTDLPFWTTFCTWNPFLSSGGIMRLGTLHSRFEGNASSPVLAEMHHKTRIWRSARSKNGDGDKNDKSPE